MDQPEPAVVKQSWKAIVKQSVWQRFFLFTILFPLGIVAFVFAWAGSISAMVNLSGDVGNVTVFRISSVLTLVLVKPALFMVGFFTKFIQFFSGAKSFDSILVLLFVDAIYVYIICTIIVVLAWSLFKKIPKLLCIISIAILWVAMFIGVYMLQQNQGLKDIIGPSWINTYYEEKGYSWDDITKLKNDSFAHYPKETIDDVLINKPIEGFTVDKNDKREEVYEASSSFGLQYWKEVKGEKVAGVNVLVVSMGSQQYLLDSYGSVFEHKENVTELEGNVVFSNSAQRPDWSWTYIDWYSGRRMIRMTAGYKPGSGFSEDRLKIVKAYLEKYPSTIDRSLLKVKSSEGSPEPISSNGQFKFKDSLDNITITFPTSVQAFKSISSAGEFVTAESYGNNFSLTSDKKMALCCEAPVLKKYLTKPSSIDSYVKSLPWTEDITKKELLTKGSKKLYYLEANSNIAVPYRVLLEGTNSGTDPIQVIELNMPDYILEQAFNIYLEEYRTRK